MDEALKLFAVMMALGAAGGGVYALIAFVNVMVKRMEGRGPAPEELEARVADLELRLEDAERAAGRIADVEERMDFVERVLPRPGEAAERGS